MIDGDDTVDAARAKAALLLAPVSAAEAALDARILVEETLGLGRAALLREGGRPFGRDAATRLDAMIGRRLAGEPLWRIIGQREFWGLPFRISPAVLDPRPDTETVVAAALHALGDRGGANLRLLDLGTGSGAILCALLHELPQARGWGVDRSLAACDVARGNVDALGLAGRALVVGGDWSASFPANAFDLVVANPPYVASATIGSLAIEVRDHDPHAALDGGADGLACYRAIVPDLPRLLAPGGFAALEIGAGQAPDVGALLRDAGLVDVECRADLAGHQRAVTARLP